MLQEISNFISNLGFPIFVACFLLIKFNSTLKSLEMAIKEMSAYFKKQNGNK